MIPEDYIPQKWLNSIFSELLNYELVQNPYEEWFLWSEATLKKREWLFTDKWVWWVYNWQADAELVSKEIVWWVAFFWDVECNVYRFEKNNWSYVMTKIYSNPASPDPGHLTLFTVNAYWKKVKQRALSFSYLSVLEKSWTADKVNSTNDDWNWNVILAVNEDNTFSASDVWKYIYFTNSASTSAKYQIRQIVQYVDKKTVYLDQQFYAEPALRASNEPWETYKTIDTIVVFNNIRNSAWLVLCIDATTNEAYFRNFWWNDIEFFEWRLWMISWYWTSVWGSLASWEYEILDPNTALWSSINLAWQKMDSLILTKNYLLVNQENSMSVVWQMWYNTQTTPIYNMNSISSWESSFWYDSIFYKSWLYYLAKDRTFNWWDIVPTSTNLIELQTKNQWIIIDKFLSRIRSTDYVSCYDFWRWKIIQHNDWVKTYMLVYDYIYECRLPWEYNVVINDKFEMFYEDLLICVWDKICIKKWNNDLWNDIRVRAVITWPRSSKNSISSLLKLKIWLWYFWNVVKFKMRLDLWNQVFESKIEKDINWVEYLTWQNIWWLWTSLWLVPLWMNWLWWNNVVNDYIAKLWLLWIPVWKKCTYFKFEIENIDNYDLNIVWITSITETWNPYITPLQNVT